MKCRERCWAGRRGARRLVSEVLAVFSSSNTVGWRVDSALKRLGFTVRGTGLHLMVVYRPQTYFDYLWQHRFSCSIPGDSFLLDPIPIRIVTIFDSGFVEYVAGRIVVNLSGRATLLVEGICATNIVRL